MPVVIVPPPYRGPTQGAERITVAGCTVGECLDAVESLHPGFGTQVFDLDHSVHGFVRLFVNGDQIGAQELSRPVSDADEVEILAAIAGG